MKSRNRFSILSALVFTLLPAAIALPACGDDEASVSGPTGGPGGTGGNGGEGGGNPDQICLLHNCESDDHCGACSDGRNTCLVAEGRCVACDAATGSGCPDGFECSAFGNCVPEGLTCPTDNGTPTITCTKSADCAACDPAHLICDSAAGKCVACIPTDTSECQSTDICIDNACSPKCPTSCQEDNDCAQCGDLVDPDQQGEPLIAHACNAHKCSECSPTYACPAGEECSPQGVCVTPCGLDGPVDGTCETNADCVGCGTGETQICHSPVNGGHGVCGPEATGCSDLGDGVIVLPAPWNQFTNACSNDNDCVGVGIQYNVGELLRDLTGIDQIGDANIEYPMAACAEITVGVGGNSVSCGICVPCEEDSDCQDIQIDEVAGDAFGPLGSIATALLLDQLFGPNEHKIHMYCESIAAGYGVCAPCPGLLNDCGVGGGGGGSGNCDHDTCSEGTALDPSCGDCAEAICAIDDYCCTTEWDSTCVGHVETECAGSCDGGGGSCTHGQCELGAALDASCNSCTDAICAEDAFCCQTEWDQACIDHVDTFCGGDCGGGGCSHGECEAGGPLEASCSACAADVCDQDPFCCNTDWDGQCVSQADSLCGGC